MQSDVGLMDRQPWLPIEPRYLDGAGKVQNVSSSATDVREKGPAQPGPRLRSLEEAFQIPGAVNDAENKNLGFTGPVEDQMPGKPSDHGSPHIAEFWKPERAQGAGGWILQDAKQRGGYGLLPTPSQRLA